MIEQIIEEEIKRLMMDFERYPDKYLTEEDARCFLAVELMKHQQLSEMQITEDKSKSIALHTEVRWHGNSGKLKWRSDIVIIDVSSLRVKNNVFRLPSKGYGFNKPLAIVEIKLRRVNGPSDNMFIKKIRNDIRRLDKIIRELPYVFPCYLIILDKKRNINDILQTVNRNESIECFYQYSTSRD